MQFLRNLSIFQHRSGVVYISAGICCLSLFVSVDIVESKVIITVIFAVEMTSS